MTGIPLQALLVGDVRSLGPRGIPSGIAKASVDRPLSLGPLGLAPTRRGLETSCQAAAGNRHRRGLDIEADRPGAHRLDISIEVRSIGSDTDRGSRQAAIQPRSLSMASWPVPGSSTINPSRVR